MSDQKTCTIGARTDQLATCAAGGKGKPAPSWSECPVGLCERHCKWLHDDGHEPKRVLS